MKDSEIIKNTFNSIPADSNLCVMHMINIADRIAFLMKEKGYDTLTLSHLTGIPTRKINRMLDSIYNFTLKEISKLEAAFQEEIIIVKK